MAPQQNFARLRSKHELPSLTAEFCRFHAARHLRYLPNNGVSKEFLQYFFSLKSLKEGSVSNDRSNGGAAA
jgi:hypothetical protein